MEHDLLIPIFAIIFAFGMPVAIVWLVLRANNAKREMTHATIGKLLDAGKDVPLELLREFETERPKSYLQRGLTLTGTGIGLWIFLSYLVGEEIGAVGAIPLFLGLAYITIWKLEKKQAEQE